MKWRSQLEYKQLWRGGQVLAQASVVLACGGMVQSGRLFKQDPTSFRVWAMSIYPVFQLQARQSPYRSDRSASRCVFFYIYSYPHQYGRVHCLAQHENRSLYLLSRRPVNSAWRLFDAGKIRFFIS